MNILLQKENKGINLQNFSWEYNHKDQYFANTRKQQTTAAMIKDILKIIIRNN